MIRIAGIHEMNMANTAAKLDPIYRDASLAVPSAIEFVGITVKRVKYSLEVNIDRILYLETSIRL